MNDSVILEIKKISKSFSGVSVLTDVDFDLKCGELHAIVGENGAGKSTLIKILSGAYERDDGEIIFNGKSYENLTPKKAHELGIFTIYQERNLIPHLSVGENLLLGNEPIGRIGIVRWKQTFEQAEEILKRLNLKKLFRCWEAPNSRPSRLQRLYTGMSRSSSWTSQPPA